MTSGGKRAGAGRKANPDKKVQMSVTITPRTKERVQILKDSKVNINEHFERMIERLTEDLQNK